MTLQRSSTLLALAAAGLFVDATRAHASDVDNPVCLTTNPINYALNAFVPIGDNPTNLAPMKRNTVFVPMEQRQGLTVKRLVVIGDHFAKEGDAPPRASTALQALMESADLILGNVEAPITRNDNALELDGKQAFNFHQNLAYLRSSMAQACIDPARTILSVANNHSGDGGRWYPAYDANGLPKQPYEPGTPTTALELGVRGIVGIDRSSATAPEIQVHDLGALRVGVVAWTHIQNTAPRSTGGRIDLPTWEASRRVLSTDFAAKKKQLGIDLLIGLPHWDCQWYLYPRTQTVRTADALYALGFNQVFGAHPGIWQPAKRLGGQRNPHNDLVFFSLGSFNEPGVLNNYPAPVLELLVDQDGRTLEFTLHAFVTHKEEGVLAKQVTCPSGKVYADDQAPYPATRTSQWIIKPLEDLAGSEADEEALNNFRIQFQRVFPE
jgi:Bacterial capsule synthesis protein PGA_cap